MRVVPSCLPSPPCGDKGMGVFAVIHHSSTIQHRRNRWAWFTLFFTMSPKPLLSAIVRTQICKYHE